ncbi:MAG: right-handed parallel beta-helix repeat-containing protein [Krumholzibacteria bacterium]|nr:right-handed parallel beta-helix repeat-containing protein [Candidatus Krumholzibacteria bacterium]
MSIRNSTRAGLLALALAAGAVLPWAGAAGAAEYLVRPDGTGDFTTIQAAVNACVDGDVVVVADGTYTGAGNQDIDFGGRDITVRSRFGPAGCIIEPSWARGFYFHGGETNAAILQGFTVRGGTAYGAGGGGILCDGAWPTLVDMVIDDSWSAGHGGGIAVLNTGTNYVTMLNTLVIGNTAQDDGGGIYVSSGRLRMRTSTVDHNQANRGGGIYFGTYTNVDITDNIIWGNWIIGPYPGTGQVGGPLGGPFDTNLIQDWSQPGSTNFSGNPAFVAGPQGDHYLNPATSDAVDAGGAAAAAVCIATADGTVCMDALTTRTTGQRDAGTVDVGYHYGLGAETLNVPAAFPTIQAAVDAATDGDTVALADGTYTGAGNRDVTLRGKAITVRSASGNAAACIIDCQGSASEPHRAFVINSGEGPDTVVENLTVTHAHSTYGSGMVINGATPRISGCVFTNSTGYDGGGILVGAGGAPVISGCVFRGNSVTDAGAGIIVSGASAAIENCLFEDNWSQWGGTGIYFHQGTGTVTGCTFTGNVCANWGGAIHASQAASSVVVSGCTFDGNQAPQGAHLYVRVDAHLGLENCVLTAGLTGAAAYALSGGTVSAACSDVWGNAGGDWTGPLAGQAGVGGNLSADPLYCDAPAGNYTVADTSPCAAANNPGCGQIGAWGVGCTGGPRTWQVNPDGSGDVPTIQAAIDAAQDGDTVMLGAGTFTGAGNRDLDYRGKAITVRGQSGGSPSVIDCLAGPGNEHRGFRFATGEGSGSVLAHVTVTGGYAWDGGGLVATEGAAPTVRDCRFVGNASTDDGGGVFLSWGSSPRLVRCEISGNTAANRGGGLYAHASVADLDSCTVADNSAVNRGGGIYTHEAGSVDLDDCVVSGNTAPNGGGVAIQGPATSSLVRVRFAGNAASGSGGGLYERDGAVTTFDHCEFQGNTADLGGGVYNVFSCREAFTACTFTGNAAATRGGAMRIYTHADVAMDRCLLWGDEAGLGDEIAISSSCTLDVDCSDVAGGQAAMDDYDHTSVITWGAGNIDAFPYFCDGTSGDLGLVSGVSPCLPAGNPCAVQIGARGAGCSPPAATGDQDTPPARTRLEAARPNPFNPSTSIGFALARSGRIRLAVHDARGRLVRVLVDEFRAAGPGSVDWDGRDDRGRHAGTGVYFYRLVAPEVRLTGKMTLLR